MTIVKKGSASFETKRPGFPDWTDIDNVLKHITEIISRCVFPSLLPLSPAAAFEHVYILVSP